MTKKMGANTTQILYMGFGEIHEESLFNFMSIIMDDFFWKTQYAVIMFFIDTILILLLIFSRKRSL